MSDGSLQDVLRNYLASNGLSVRAFSNTTGINYATVLSMVNKGSVPRKQAHRDMLRETLGISERDWNQLLLTTSHVETEHGANEAVTLQQLVTRRMFERGLTEQSLAEHTDLAYPTIMGLTRKGSIPRQQSLQTIAAFLGISSADLHAALAVSKASRRGLSVDAVQTGAVTVTPPLATLVWQSLVQRGQNMAEFAQSIGVGYLGMSRLIEHGDVPESAEIRRRLQAVLELDDATFAESVANIAAADDETNGVPTRRHDAFLTNGSSPLQESLVSFMRDNKLTMKQVSEMADLSQVTISRLIKSGKLPSRSTTHHKLQHLLGLSADEYHNLIDNSTRPFTKPLSAARPPHANADRTDEQTDSYIPSDALERKTRRDSDISHIVQTLEHLDTEARAKVLELAKRLNDQ